MKKINILVIVNQQIIVKLIVTDIRIHWKLDFFHFPNINLYAVQSLKID